jgi:hypothetical protein
VYFHTTLSGVGGIQALLVLNAGVLFNILVCVASAQQLRQVSHLLPTSFPCAGSGWQQCRCYGGQSNALLAASAQLLDVKQHHTA